MKKVLSVVLSMVIVSMAFTGCGKEKKDETTGKVEENNSAEEKEESGEKKKLVWFTECSLRPTEARISVTWEVPPSQVNM